MTTGFFLFWRLNLLSRQSFSWDLERSNRQKEEEDPSH